MIEITVENLQNVDEQQWNGRIATVPGSFASQTTFFSRARRASYGGNHLFLTAKIDQEVVGQLLALGSHR